MILLVLCIIIFTRAAVYNFNDNLVTEVVPPASDSEAAASLMAHYFS